MSGPDYQDTWWGTAWLRNSLEHRRNEMRARAAAARRAGYTSEPMVSSCRALAEAYDEAAQVFEDRLQLIERRMPPLPEAG